MEDEVDEKSKKKKKDKGQERKELTAEEKYEIANFESEALKKNIDDGRDKSDSILETLRVILILIFYIIFSKFLRKNIQL